MKRKLAVAILAISLVTPAYAVAPLAAILISYVKQALKDKLISYAKEKASGLMGEALAYAPRPTMSAANTAALQSAGFNDTDAKPFSAEEWKEYEESVVQMAKAAPEGSEMPDFGEMRAAMADMPPQFIGMLRVQLRQFQQLKAEQDEMRKAWAGMSEADGQDVVVELSKSFHELSAEDRPQATRVLQSGALGLPDELTRRLLLALKILDVN